MRFFCAILVTVVCAHVARAGVIVSAPESGWADMAWAETEVFQWGATARNMDFSNGDREIGIGGDHAMSGDTMDLDWDGPGTAHAFLLDYDPAHLERAIWNVDGRETVLPDPYGLFTDLYIQLKDRPGDIDARNSMSDASITFDGLSQSIDDLSVGYGEAAELRYIHIRGFDDPLSDIDFILEGRLSIDWSGSAPPSRDETGFHLKLTQIPEPASILMVILVSVSGLFIRRRFS